MHRRIIFLGMISALIMADCALAETAIKAEVDNTRLTTDDTLTYKIIVTSSENKLPAVEAPKFEGFSIISQADSSTISFVKGNVKTILVYAFILAPAATGKFTIAPSTIRVKNITYSSEVFEIEVTQGKATPKTIPQEKEFSPLQPGTEEPQFTL